MHFVFFVCHQAQCPLFYLVCAMYSHAFPQCVPKLGAVCICLFRSCILGVSILASPYRIGLRRRIVSRPHVVLQSHMAYVGQFHRVDFYCCIHFHLVQSEVACVSPTSCFLRNISPMSLLVNIFICSSSS